MTDLEFARWTTKVAADAVLAAQLVSAPSCMRFPTMLKGDLDSARGADLSWVASVVSIDPSSFRSFEEWDKRPAIESLKTQTSIAIHEAGHMVMNEQFLVPGTCCAVALSLGGRSGLSWHPRTSYRIDVIQLLGAPLIKASGSYAGRLAELMASGSRWTLPVMDIDQDDFREANKVLTAVEGQPLLAMMAKAQQIALGVLHLRWPRLIEIAEQLVAHGSYAAEIKAENQLQLPGVIAGSPVVAAGEVGG
jgi:hypothetical protein